MKVLKFVVPLVVATVLLASWLSISTIEASGPGLRSASEYCWELDDGAIIRLAVTNVGNQHYLLNGRLEELDGRIQPMIGNAEIKDGKVYMVITSAGAGPLPSSETSAIIGRAVLDLPSLNGTIEISGMYHDPLGSPGNCHCGYEGPMALTFVQCP
jgi:hypothetical protein